MTKKDYILIAEAIKEAQKPTMQYNNTPREIDAVQYGIRLATVAIANALASENTRFDRARFVGYALLNLEK